MAKHSILVALSGSEQSRFAAEMAWKIAKKIDAEVTAEHVVDSRTIWQLLRSDKPGFVGSGPYIAAYETVITSLNSLANKLSMEYEAQASGAGVSGSCVIKDGNPVEVLSRDAGDHDLLVIGHLPSGARSIDSELTQYIRYSIAEGVAHESSVPVLIVQSQAMSWESMTIVSEIDHINAVYIRSCVKLAKLLGLKPRLEFWGTGMREEAPDAFRKDILAMIPETKNLDMDIEYFIGDAAVARKELFHGREILESADVPSETLFVLPTRGIARERLTVFGMEPHDFIRSLTLPCLLLWPEEKAAFNLTDEAGQKTLSSVKK